MRIYLQSLSTMLMIVVFGKRTTPLSSVSRDKVKNSSSSIQSSARMVTGTHCSLLTAVCLAMLLSNVKSIVVMT